MTKSNFNTDFLTRQADRNELSAIVHRQGVTVKQVSQAFVRMQSLDEVANQIGELDYRVVSSGGVVRMVMSAVSLEDEFGVNANFAAFNESGVVTFYVDADDGSLHAGGGDVFMDQFGFFVKNQEGFIGFQDLTSGGYDSVGFYIDGFDELVIQNQVGGKAIRMDIDDVSHAVFQYSFSATECYIPAPTLVVDGDVNLATGGTYKINGTAHQHNSTDTIGAFLGGVTVPASTTWYGCPFKTTVDINQNSFPWSEGGVLSLMSVRVSTTQSATGSLVATLQVNGSDTALVVTITSADGSPVTRTDNTHTVNISATDTLRWKFVNNATAASATLQAIGMKLTKATT